MAEITIASLQKELEATKKQLADKETQLTEAVQELHTTKEALNQLSVDGNSVSFEAQKPVETPKEPIKIGGKKYEWQYSTINIPGIGVVTAVDLALPENKALLEELVKTGCSILKEIV
jgi:hypothetical protein